MKIVLYFSAKGMKSTKADEIFLMEMQREQMIEKKRIQQSQEDVDMMWHQVLLEDVRIKVNELITMEFEIFVIKY